MAIVNAITSGLNTRHIKFAHTAIVAALTIILLRGRVLVAQNDTAANVDNIWVFEGDLEAPKAGVAILAGATAYWDDVNNVFTDVAAGNTKCGVFTEDALIGDAVVQIYLTNEVNL